MSQRIFTLSIGWLPQSISEWKFGLEYLAAFHFNANCKGGEEKSETDINDEKSLEERESGDANEFSFEDNRNKNAPEVHQEKIDGVFVKNERDIKGKPGKEYLSEPDLSEESKTGASISENLFVKENVYNFGQHTCMKSTATSGHGSLRIDIKSYVLIMLQKIGAQQTVKIILATQLRNVFFTQEFYYKCILSSQAEHHQRCVSGYLFCSVLENFSIFLMFEKAFAVRRNGE